MHSGIQLHRRYDFFAKSFIFDLMRIEDLSHKIQNERFTHEQISPTLLFCQFLLRRVAHLQNTENSSDEQFQFLTKADRLIL
jgi:hypothetical protein